MNLKLASTLTVRSVTSESGPLLFLRVRNQDSLRREPARRRSRATPSSR